MRTEPDLREIGTNAIAYEMGKLAEQKRILEIIDDFWKDKWQMHFTMVNKNELKAQLKGDTK